MKSSSRSTFAGITESSGTIQPTILGVPHLMEDTLCAAHDGV